MKKGIIKLQDLWQQERREQVERLEFCKREVKKWNNKLNKLKENYTDEKDEKQANKEFEKAQENYKKELIKENKHWKKLQETIRNENFKLIIAIKP